MRTPARRSFTERFWPKVDKRADDECWLWTGARTGGRDTKDDRYGYLGRVPASRFGPVIPAKRAHVASWEIHNGPVPHGMVICHRCDITLCVNPAHLYAGTQRQNMHDRDSKGRGADRHGERNPHRKLTADQVAAIRERHRQGETQDSLAAEYGVIQPHISRIVRGENWSSTLTAKAATPQTRLDPASVAEIRERHAEGEVQVALSREYGVTQAQISRIVKGRSWSS